LRGWERNLARAIETRHYDVEVRFSEPQSTALAERLRGIRGVRLVEAWSSSSTAVAHPGEVMLNHAYPDHAHGNSSILAPPADTKLVQMPLRQGRWLIPKDEDAVVLTQVGAALFPGVRLGDPVMLSVNDAPTRWRVIGFVQEFGPAPVAYVTDKAFARAAGTGDKVKLFRIQTDAQSAFGRETTVQLIETELTHAGASIETVSSVPLLRNILGDHMGILTGALVVMSLLMAAVGAFGLASTMSISVLQRTRELGVMKAIGATPGNVAWIIIREGLLTGALSWIFAVTLAVPLTLVVGEHLGTTAFGSPISVLVSPTSAMAWLAITCVTAIAASLIPANRASKLTVREAFAHS
jgi:putative ABC transport system permease protein